MNRTRSDAVVVARVGGARRKGSVLVLVMAILGILFVTGVALLATMKFEADIQQRGRDMDRNDVSVDLIESVLDESLRKTVSLTTDDLDIAGEWDEARFSIGVAKGQTDPITGEDRTQFALRASSFADVPTVQGVVSQIDPYWPVQDADDDRHLFASITVPHVMRDGVFSQFESESLFTSVAEDFSFDRLRLVDARYRDDGEAQGAAVDADGDGIVDSRQFDVEMLGLTAQQRAAISRIVNPPDNQDAGVYLSLRTVSHGGMVNLNHAHPLLIQELLDPFDQYVPTGRIVDPWVPNQRQNQQRYVADREEPSLRYRGGLLPPRDLPVTAVQGNPDGDELARSPGGGDFGMVLFGWKGDNPDRDRETVMDAYRYWMYDQSDHESWSERVNPKSPLYDVRHVTTTISHDDLLSRTVEFRQAIHDNNTPTDVSDDPIEVVDGVTKMNVANAAGGVFLLPIYPYIYATPEEQDVIPLPEDPGILAGGLRLSLPYLDFYWYGIPVDPNDPNPPTQQQLDERAAFGKSNCQWLIHDMFMMMLQNAAHEYAWNIQVANSAEVTVGAFQPLAGGGYGVAGYAIDWMGRTPNERARERAAAALTANMIDYVDSDTIPTRVAVRDANANSGSFGMPRYHQISGAPEYVFGLETQPFISEVAAHFDTTGGGNIASYAVELFNPYDVDIVLDGYTLQVYSQINSAAVQADAVRGDRTEVAVVELVDDGQPVVVPARGYAVFVTNLDGEMANVDGDPVVASGLAFDEGQVVYLVRTLEYEDESNPGNYIEFGIVVDEFELATEGGGMQMLAAPQPPTEAKKFYSMQRYGVAASESLLTSPWSALIPVKTEVENHTLGKANIVDSDVNVTRVPVLFAGTDSFDEAFPTTGSMLLLPRFANRGLYETAELTDGDGLAFTSQLYDERYALDNGRMPVFDSEFAYHRYENGAPYGLPGGLDALPWGQLVFDYFTALPLSNGGPYADLSASSVDPAAKPRVDMGGLRVHGRIDINSAPWAVLAGLPIMPMSALDGLPAGYLARMQEPLIQILDEMDEDTDPDTAVPLGYQLAQAIVAYREMREIEDVGENGRTGDYGDDEYGRGWGPDDVTASLPYGPTFRRGTGFLSVGELANVRHWDATRMGSSGPYTSTTNPWSQFRMDAGVIGRSTADAREDYIQAVALLVALGDWVTVRSHVFTVYGTLRGEGGEGDDDVDARAIRFQETVDRLPTVLGAPVPTRIGDRVVEKYLDTAGK